MRARFFLGTLLLVTVTGAAQASVVHRCRQLDGVIAYRDTGCRAEETLVSRLRVVETAPAAKQAPSDARPARERARPAQADAQAGRRARGEPLPHASRTYDEIVAHECRLGEQRWVQAEACPAALAPAPARGGKAVKQRVDETRLTASQVCTALRAISAAQSPGEGSARRAYGMNRLRQRHGC